MRRIISIWLPRFATDRWRSRGATARTKKAAALSPSTEQAEEKPLVLTAMIKNAQQVTAVNDAAAAAGLSPGMTLSHARALIPDVRTGPADPDADRLALEKLADWCVRYSPSAGLDDEENDHGLWIDATGCAHLFGGEDSMLADLGHRLSGFGLRHRLGLADTPGAAWALGRYGDSVDSQNVRETLAGLPVAGLRLAPEIVTLLRRLGLKTIGQLDALPRAALGKRFSSKEAYESVLLRLDQLFGRVEEPLSPRRPLPVFRTEQAFLEPLTEPAALAHGLNRLTATLCDKLEKKKQGAERLAFLAFRVDGDVKMLQVGTSQATHDADHIARLFAEKLETIDPGFGIDKLALHAERTAPIETRQKKFEGGADDISSQDDRFVQLIDRLANRLGPDAVQVIIPIESHIPEHASEHVSAMGRARARVVPGETHVEAAGPSCRPSCLLLRPEPIKALAEVPDGPPLRFTWRRVTRRIVRSEGPERIAGDAVSSVDLAAETRDYYRVEDDQGQRYWLFRQGLYDRSGYADTSSEHQADAAGHSRLGWFIHGLFG
ncbi:MAG: Y-family DNA polymerase [Geminicoccaceae bacterium]